MIEIAKVKYFLYLVTGSGALYRMTDFQQSLSWEENQGELAARLQTTIRNQSYNGTYITSLASLGAKLLVYADWGQGETEVFQGSIFTWDYKSAGKKDLTLTAYDNLIYTQKSKDYRYYSAGTSSKTIILDIFQEWGVPVATYEGPDVPMAKKPFKGDTLASMVFEVLDDAKKKGAGKYIVRGAGGKVKIVPRGSNSVVYHFAADNNTIVTNDKLDIEDLVTRVKIVGSEDKEGRAPIEAVLDGKTEFGILQDIVHRAQDDTLAAAKASAQDILDERGKPKRTTSLQAPDLPFLRKGDKIYVDAGNLTGYFYISGIQHDATNRTMNMEVEEE